MNKTIYEAEFTKMVHDKMREANRFKEYERIPKNRIGGDYWNTYWTIRYMLRTMTDILENNSSVGTGRSTKSTCNTSQSVLSPVLLHEKSINKRRINEIFFITLLD